MKNEKIDYGGSQSFSFEFNCIHKIQLTQDVVNIPTGYFI